MPAYTGEIRFMGEKNDEALVYQTPTGSLYPDGYRLLHSSGFSSKSVGETINYDYVDNTDTDGDKISIS